MRQRALGAEAVHGRGAQAELLCSLAHRQERVLRSLDASKRRRSQTTGRGGCGGGRCGSQGARPLRVGIWLPVWRAPVRSSDPGHGPRRRQRRPATTARPPAAAPGTGDAPPFISPSNLDQIAGGRVIRVTAGLCSLALSTGQPGVLSRMRSKSRPPALSRREAPEQRQRSAHIVSSVLRHFAACPSLATPNSRDRLPVAPGLGAAVNTKGSDA